MGVPGLNYPKPPTSPTLGRAAGQDPFGLARKPASPVALAAGQPPGMPNPNAKYIGPPAGFLNGPSVAGKSPGSPGYVSPYDLNTDPGLQASQNLAGLSDQQANAAATKSKTDLLLGYGDANLINSVLHDPNLAAAAAANPNSTLNQLKTQHTQGLKTLGDSLNAANLDYSGYRVTQEQQAETDYQNQVAQAAAAVNSGLDTIQGSLAQALAADNANRIQAINDAQSRATAAAAASGVDPGAGTGSAAAKKAQVSPAARAILPGLTGSRNENQVARRPAKPVVKKGKVMV